jgi:flagellar hook-associated protein 2
MSVNGIYGLSGSGIDVDSMVKVGMMSRQSEYNKMAQKQQINQWTKDEYSSIYSDLSTYNYSTLSQYKMQSTMNAMTASSTNSVAVSATANGAAAAMAHTVQVTSMSSNAYLLTTDEGISRNADTADNKSTSIYLKDVLDVNSIDQDEGISFTLSNGKSSVEIKLSYNEIVRDDQTLYDLAAKFSNAKDSSGETMGLTGSYDSTNDAFSIYNSTGGSKNKIEITAHNAATGALFNQLHLGAVSLDYDAEGNQTSKISGAINFTYTPSSAKMTTTGAGITRADGSTGTNLSSLIDTAAGWDATSTIDFTVGNGSASATISLTQADVDGGLTLDDLATKINDASNNDGLGITASYDAANDVFSITNNTTGGSSKLSITVNNEKTAELFNNLHLGSVSQSYGDSGTLVEKTGDAATFSYNTATNTGTTSSATGQSGTAIGTTGQDGKAIIDGKTYTTETNRLSVSNVTYTLSGIGSSTVNVTQDTDAIIDKVKSFVDDYNKLLTTIYDKYNQPKNSDYKPLTDSQKESMTEEQIKKWEEKAKSGMLYHSQILGKIMDNMRDAVNRRVDSVNSAYNSAYSLGIDTTKTNGFLELDEDKLKKALAADPDCVYQVFGSLDPNDDYDNNGIAQRLGDVVVAAMKEVKTEAGETASMDDDSRLGNLMRELQTKMSNFKTMLNAFEESLYKKYDAMEQAISKLGVQMGYITYGQS